VPPLLGAAIGVACIAFANAAASQGASGTQPLWWLGAFAIFAPAAAMVFMRQLSRREAALIVLAAGMALYAVKLVYAPGRFWEFDELLHYPNVAALLATGRLFTPNVLLPVSPYYPGLEAVTVVLVQLTGLSIVQAGLVLIGVVHGVMVACLFLLLERIAAPRLAAAASLVYFACPAFLYFDSQFAYESLALALVVACLFTLRAAQLAPEARRFRLEVLAAVLLAAVVVTHHIASIALVAILAVWSIGEWLVTRRRRVLPGSGWVPLVGVAALAGWLFNVASATASYLAPQLASGVAQLVRIIRLEETGRTLFSSASGSTAPWLERVVGVGSVLIIIAVAAGGFRYLWTRRESIAVSRFFAIGALAYPAALSLRFARSGWEIGARAMAFIYIPLALIVAAGLYLYVERRDRRSVPRMAVAALALSLIFAGGIIATTSPHTRQPAPYNPGLAWTPFDVESLAAARWASTTFGPGHRIAADAAGGVLMGSLGRQDIVASDDEVSISQLFLFPDVGPKEIQMLKSGRIDYVMVDRRISEVQPVKGYIYERWEQTVQAYGSTVSSETVNKFDQIHGASKVFDSGNIQLFELRRLLQ